MLSEVNKDQINGSASKYGLAIAVRATGRHNQCGHPCANKDARQSEPRCALKHEGSSMPTIAARLRLATTTAVRQPGSHHVIAAVLATATTGHVAGLAALLLMILAVVFLSSLSSAARGLATVLSELLRVVAAVTSLMFTLVIAIFLVIVLMLHH
jgi:hypothetical protein